MSSGDYLLRNEAEVQISEACKDDEITRLKAELRDCNERRIVYEKQAIQQCNENDVLRAEIEHGEMMNACLDSSLGFANEQLQQAKEMLRKCSPYSSGGTNYWVSICNHCDTLKENGHADNCPYIKMIGC